MFSKLLLASALAGAVAAFTPPGFEPASSNNLTVAFGNTLAVNGVNLPRAETASAPTIATTERLSGSYTIMMVDPDIPPQTIGGATSELLHWMQSGLVSSNESTTIGGIKVFELVNPSNTAPFASYIQPTPPNKVPLSHRYTQLLLNTTGNSSALTTLAKFSTTRTNFSAVNVVKSAGLTVLMGNSFNVTNTTSSDGSSTGNSTTSGAGNPTATSSSGTVQSTNAAENLRKDGAMIAGFGALVAMVVLL